MGGILGGHINSGGAVAGTDDTYGHRIQLGKAEHKGQHQRQKDAALSRRSQEKGPGILQKRGKVGHGPDTDKNEQGEELGHDPGIVNNPEKSPLLHEPCQGDIDQDTPEPDGNKEQRFKVLFDPKIQENGSHGDHDGI